MIAKTSPHFMVIDDDPFNNMLCELLLTSKMAASSATVQTFTAPEEALKYIQENYRKVTALTILLLDINMPGISGWNFLDVFDKFDKSLKNLFKIYILSSSVDERDKKRAEKK